MPHPTILSGGRRIRRALLASLIGWASVLIVAELGLRYLLFGTSSIARRAGAGWRHAERYADPRSEDEYWKLQYEFLDPSARRDVPEPDPVCGWTGAVRSDTDAPYAATDLRGRRPVLLYGDSYARCTTTPSHCFPSLLEHSELADRFCMINYGVGGYGLDQIDLLLRGTIDRWKDLDPIVVVSFLVDDDFHRNTLTFRSFPKRRFVIDGDRLVLSGPPILPSDEFLTQHPVRIRSYLWRILVFRKGILPDAWQSRMHHPFEHREEQVALGRRILEDIDGQLASRGLTHFFLAFHGWDSLQASPSSGWADELASETAARLGTPILGTRPYFLAATGGDVARAGERLFDPTGNRHGHYNELGNAVAFEAMRQGIEGRFEPLDTSRIAGLLDRYPFHDAMRSEQRCVDTTFLGSAARVRLLGESGLARSSNTPYAPFDRESTEDYLILRPGTGGPTTVQIAIPDGAVRLRGKAISVAAGGKRATEKALVLHVKLDGKQADRIEPSGFPGGADFDVDVAGAKELELDVERIGPYSADEWIHLASPRFAWKP